MKHIFILFFTFYTCFALSQDSIIVNKNFQFKDGIYLSFEEFQANQPSFDWLEVQASVFTNPQTFLTQIVKIYIPEGNERFELPAESIYAISLDGIPSIQLKGDDLNRELPTFAALKVRGKICYYAFPMIKKKNIAMNAYNPKNGIPFRTGMIEREVEVFSEKILHFETGEIKDFNVLNFLEWIQDDKDLVKTVQNLHWQERQEKLFKCLLIYDDRNNVFLK